jgi:hypothetical protein
MTTDRDGIAPSPAHKSGHSYVDLMKLFAKQKPVEFRTPYLAGYDCGLNGANEKNCHFGWFSTVAHTRAWEHGKADGDAASRARGES